MTYCNICGEELPPNERGLCPSCEAEYGSELANRINKTIIAELVNYYEIGIEQNIFGIKDVNDLNEMDASYIAKCALDDGHILDILTQIANKAYCSGVEEGMKGAAK